MPVITVQPAAIVQSTALVPDPTFRLPHHREYHLWSTVKGHVLDPTFRHPYHRANYNLWTTVEGHATMGLPLLQWIDIETNVAGTTDVAPMTTIVEDTMTTFVENITTSKMTATDVATMTTT